MPGFPRGVLIVQDELTANYKLVSLAAVDAVFPLPPPYIPGAAPPPLVDAGSADAGTADGGFTDAGVSDGGGVTGFNPRPAPSAVDPTPSCGCTGGAFTVLPALLLLWWIRRRSP